MRNPHVRFQIDVYAIEHDPFAIRRRHWRADALQFHHVLECEWMLLRWRSREHRRGEQKECCEETLHKRPSFRLTPSGASSVLGSGRRGDLATPNAFASRELLPAFVHCPGVSSQTKFVAVEYGDQHATSMRSPERRRSTHQLRALLSNHGNNRKNQERPLHRDGRSGIDRRGWKQFTCRYTSGT